MWKYKGSQREKIILSKFGDVSIITYDLTFYYRAIVTERGQYGPQKSKQSSGITETTLKNTKRFRAKWFLINVPKTHIEQKTASLRICTHDTGYSKQNTEHWSLPHLTVEKHANGLKILT